MYVSTDTPLFHRLRVRQPRPAWHLRSICCCDPSVRRNGFPSRTVAAIVSIVVESFTTCTYRFPASVHDTGTERCSSQSPLSQKARTNSNEAVVWETGTQMACREHIIGRAHPCTPTSAPRPVASMSPPQRGSVRAPDRTTAARDKQFHAQVLRCCTVIEGSDT
jgi:hypothetical protein